MSPFLIQPISIFGGVVLAPAGVAVALLGDVLQGHAKAGGEGRVRHDAALHVAEPGVGVADDVVHVHQACAHASDHVEAVAVVAHRAHVHGLGAFASRDTRTLRLTGGGVRALLDLRVDRPSGRSSPGCCRHSSAQARARSSGVQPRLKPVMYLVAFSTSSTQVNSPMLMDAVAAAARRCLLQHQHVGLAFVERGQRSPQAGASVSDDQHVGLAVPLLGQPCRSGFGSGCGVGGLLQALRRQIRRGLPLVHGGQGGLVVVAIHTAGSGVHGRGGCRIGHGRPLDRVADGAVGIRRPLDRDGLACVGGIGGARRAGVRVGGVGLRGIRDLRSVGTFCYDEPGVGAQADVPKTPKTRAQATAATAILRVPKTTVHLLSQAVPSAQTLDAAGAPRNHP